MEVKEAEKIIWDCIVVGSGVAGAYFSYLLAKEGWRVLVIERGKIAGAKKACGGAIPPFLSKKLPTKNIVSYECKDVSIIYNGRIRTLKSTKPFILMCRRSQLDKMLMEEAKNAGAVVLNLLSVIDIKVGCTEVVCRKVNSIELVKLKANYIVLADGATTIATRIGIGYNWKTQDYIRALKFDIKVNGYNEGVKFIIDNDIMALGYCWVFPKGEILNVGLGGIPSKIGESFQQLMQIFLQRYFAGGCYDLENKKGGIVPLEMAKKFASGRILVIGDAAGLVNPMTGGGIHYAFKSAEIAKKLINERLKKGAKKDLNKFNMMVKVNIYYFWLKLMRILFVIMGKAKNYNGIIYYYFLVIYFQLFIKVFGFFKFKKD